MPSSDSEADETTGSIMVLLVIIVPFLGGTISCDCGWWRVLVGMVLRKNCLLAQLQDFISEILESSICMCSTMSEALWQFLASG